MVVALGSLQNGFTSGISKNQCLSSSQPSGRNVELCLFKSTSRKTELMIQYCDSIICDDVQDVKYLLDKELVSPYFLNCKDCVKIL